MNGTLSNYQLFVAAALITASVYALGMTQI